MSDVIDAEVLLKLKEHIRSLSDTHHIKLFHTVERAKRHGFLDDADIVNLGRRAPIDSSRALPLELTMALFTKEHGSKGVLGPPVTDDTNYAAVLHEFGHHLAPNGALRLTQPDAKNWTGLLHLSRLHMIEEYAAWEWARTHAVIWTPPMTVLEQRAIDSHTQSHQLVEIGAQCDKNLSPENILQLVFQLERLGITPDDLLRGK